MAEYEEWEFPAAAQPNAEDVGFALDEALSSVVSLRSEIPDDAFTASILGTERGGNGVVISNDGLVLTVGYLIAEAETVWLVSGNGKATPAHVVGYDQTTGLGLVQALGQLDAPAIALGASRSTRVGDPVIVAGHGGRRHALNAKIVAKREFAGYWEYVLDEAIFTQPAHPLWGGAALIGADGTLRGIGSLLVQAAQDDDMSDEINMFVPIDLLAPIRDDLLKFGKVDQPPRPWLGMLTMEADDNLVVAGLTDGAPAEQAGLRLGDIVAAVADTPPTDLVDMYRRIWALGPAGTVIPLTIDRSGDQLTVDVQSADRNAFLKPPDLH